MFEDYELLINLNHPWNKFAVGWEYVPPDDEMEFNSLLIHLTFITIIFNYT